MATAYKSPKQSSPNANTLTDLYTVPAATQAVASSISVCNRDSNPGKFRIAVSVGGGAIADKDYLHYDTQIAGNDNYTATIGPTLTATDIVRVYSSNGLISFNMFYLEIT